MHGGTVTVASEVDRGSRFTVSLPWEATTIGPWRNGNPLHEPPASPCPSAQSPRTILLVEDNEDNIVTLSDYLLVKGYRVVVARNGVEALNRARDTSPGLILMDIQMPEMDGLEAMRHIRADAQLSAVPIVALTALAMAGDHERCLEAGANDYLSKPISLKSMVMTIETYLHRGVHGTDQRYSDHA